MLDQIRDFFIKYEPKEYWERRGTQYIREYKSGTRAFAVSRPILERTLVDSLRRTEFNSVIEIGCNFGKNLKLIDKNFKGKKIFGLDISTTAIAEAKKFLKNPKIKFFNSNASKMQFKDNNFDVVLVGEVFEHVPCAEFDKTLGEVIRVAKKYIIFISPDHSKDSKLFRLVHARHVFRHDYVKEFAARDSIKLISQHPVDANQIIYVLKKTGN